LGIVLIFFIDAETANNMQYKFRVDGKSTGPLGMFYGKREGS
jgi:hypothetical protein